VSADAKTTSVTIVDDLTALLDKPAGPSPPGDSAPANGKSPPPRGNHSLRRGHKENGVSASSDLYVDRGTQASPLPVPPGERGPRPASPSPSLLRGSPYRLASADPGIDTHGPGQPPPCISPPGSAPPQWRTQRPLHTKGRPVSVGRFGMERALVCLSRRGEARNRDARRFGDLSGEGLSVFCPSKRPFSPHTAG